MNKYSNRLFIFLSLGAIITIFFLNAMAHFNYTPDDAYIYFQYARNLLAGNGISFNAGQPTYGITSPLWLCIISLGGWLGAEVCPAAKWVDIFFACSSLLLLYFLANKVIGNKAVAIVSVFAFSMNAWFMRWAGSGMESSLAVLLILSVVLCFIRENYYLSIFFTALLALVRPEGSLFAGIIFADVLFFNRGGRNKKWMVAALAGIFLITLIPWLVYAKTIFGTIAPNTMLGKVGFNFSFRESYLTLIDAVETLAIADGIAVITLATFAYVVSTKKPLMERESLVDGDDENIRNNLVVFGWGVVLVLFYVVTDTNVVSRYLLLIAPFFTLYGFHFLYRFLKINLSEHRVYAGIFILMSLIIVQNQIFYVKIVRPGIEAFSFGMDNCLIPIGKWLYENTDPRATVLAGDIGAIGYYSERKLYDAAGLASPEFLPLLHGGMLPYEIIENHRYDAYCKPDYIIHRSVRPEVLGDNRTLFPLLTKPFYRMGLNNHQTIYYTIYRVKNP